MANPPTHMKKLPAIVMSIWLGSLWPAAAAASCDYPRSPSVPNGETVSADELRDTQDKVRAFLAKAEAYLACLEAMEKDAAEPPSARQAEINVARYNAMVDEMHRVSDEYNVAVRIFKSQQ